MNKQCKYANICASQNLFEFPKLLTFWICVVSLLAHSEVLNPVDAAGSYIAFVSVDLLVDIGIWMQMLLRRSNSQKFAAVNICKSVNKL
jgi:hypothetical protein